MIYAKLAAVLAILAAAFAAGFHFGGLGPTAALQADRAAQSELTAKAVLAERASAQATAARDHTTEETHAKTIVQIDSAPPIRTPVFLCAPGDPLRAGAVPGSQAQAGGVAADPAARGGQPVGGADDLRPSVEALKRQLERVMADYRQLDAEWPQ